MSTDDETRQRIEEAERLIMERLGAPLSEETPSNLATFLASLSEEDYRNARYGSFEPPEDTWVDWVVLRDILRPRAGWLRPSIGARFTYEAKRWQIADYDRHKDRYRVVDLGPLAKQGRPSAAPGLGGQHGITGNEPMLGSKPESEGKS